MGLDGAREPAQAFQGRQPEQERAQRDASAEALALPLVRLWHLQQDYRSIMNLARTLDPATIADAWTLYRMGEAFLKTGQPAEAIRYFSLAVDRAPEHLRFQDKLATAYSEDGQLQAAISIYDTILEANPKFATSYNNRGFARALLGDLDGAEADFLAALRLDPDETFALANLASLSANTDRKAEARPYVQRLIRLDPENQNYRRFAELLN